MEDMLVGMDGMIDEWTMNGRVDVDLAMMHK